MSDQPMQPQPPVTDPARRHPLGQGEETGTVAAGSSADAPSPAEAGQGAQGSPVGHPEGGQGDLSAETGRGERGTADPDQDMGEGSDRPFYAR